jgi:hypothetical protein
VISLQSVHSKRLDERPANDAKKAKSPPTVTGGPLCFSVRRAGQIRLALIEFAGQKVQAHSIASHDPDRTTAAISVPNAKLENDNTINTSKVASSKRGADVRPDFNWSAKPLGATGYRWALASQVAIEDQPIRRCWSFLPALSCARTQCGCFPRLDHISVGFVGFWYFGRTFG